jgi:hypothetical protein
MVKLIAVYKDPKNDEDVLEYWITLTKADISRSIVECIVERDLPWPPDWLLMKVGKRRWYEFTKLWDMRKMEDMSGGALCD